MAGPTPRAPLGKFPPGPAPHHPGYRTEIAAGVVSGIWVVAVLAWALVSAPAEGDSGPGLGLILLILFLPLLIIWLGVVALRAIRDLREEAARLHETVAAMHSSYLQAQSQPGGNPAPHGSAQQPPALQPPALQPHDSPSEPRQPEESPPLMREPAAVQPSFSTRRDAAMTVPSADRKAALTPARPEPEAEQPGLALGTPSEAPREPLSVADFVRALQFPESPEDKAGFRALRLALEDREVARLIRSAQDVLTLISQEGIYMDDLKPEMCHPDLWRRFAAGERGRGVAGVGGIRDRSSMALTAARMREDTIFRDAAHHFLRTFDKVFQAFEKNASDAEIAALADTRTARAFMIVGRVAGVFD